MTVSVPGWKSAVTAFTATWPPKRIVRSRVDREGCDAWSAMSALVLDRQRHFGGRDLAHQFQQVPLVLLVLLDAEVVHRLDRLVVFLAEAHGALRGLEAHAFHGRHHLVAVLRVRRLAQGRDHGAGRG